MMRLLMVMMWPSGNVLCLISEVTLHRAWLVPGWVTVCGQVTSWYVTSHSGRLSLLPSVGDKMSISFWAE